MRIILTAATSALAIAAFAGVVKAAAIPAARVFVNVKLTAEVNQVDAKALADGYCASKGYAYAASYQDRLVVQSKGYVRFASLRCQGTATGTKSGEVAAAE